jgi:hypothetical protein
MPRRRLINQMSDSRSASGNRRPCNTSVMRRGLTRKAAARLWTASRSLRRFQISMASGSVSRGDLGVERGNFGRDLGFFELSAGCRRLCCSCDDTGLVGSGCGIGINGLPTKAACQARRNRYVIGVVITLRAALAAVTRLRRATLAVWPFSLALSAWRASARLARQNSSGPYLPPPPTLIRTDSQSRPCYRPQAGWAATLKVGLGRAKSGQRSLSFPPSRHSTPESVDCGS